MRALSLNPQMLVTLSRLVTRQWLSPYPRQVVIITSHTKPLRRARTDFQWYRSKTEPEDGFRFLVS
jgi:hypothetical protein